MSISSHLAKAVERHTSKQPKKEGKKKISHFRVEPADDKSGYTVETHFKSDKGDMGYREPHKSIHKSLSSVNKHMKEMCGESEEKNEME